MVQLIIVVVISVAASLGGTFAMNTLMPPQAAAPAPAAEAEPVDLGVAHYLPLDPALVVNLSDDEGETRFLQTSVQIMSRDDKVIDEARTHSPAIRSELIMLFGTVRYDSITSREGKEELQERALEVVNEVMTKHTGKGGVDALFLTSFVVQ